MNIKPDHPVESFTFEILGEDSAWVKTELESMLEQMASVSAWIIAPPSLFEQLPNSDDGTKPALEGYLEIYSARTSEKLPTDVDKAHLEEVTRLIRSLQDLSRKYKLVIDCHLDDTFVGSIQEGATDALIEDTFLGEWRKHLVT